MRVVMATSEMVPFAKTGGLADVLGALPGALVPLGVDVSVILPNYGFIEHLRHHVEPTGIQFDVPVSSRSIRAQIFRTTIREGFSVYLIGADPYFARPGIYGENGDYGDNAERFAFFSRAVLGLLQRFAAPDILHVHDWQTSLALAFLRADSARYPSLQQVRTVLTIHNLGYQGRFWGQDWHLLNLDPTYFAPQFLEFFGDINYLKAGLVFADALTTVSPTYAKEIQTAELGHGLDGVLRGRQTQLTGILNGVDYSEWDPAHDPHIAATYTRKKRSAKAICKRDLQAAMGLPQVAEVPLIGMVSRLADQKGFDILAAALPTLLQRRAQFVILGSGDARYQDLLRSQAQANTDRLAVQIGFDNALAHKIEAGSDMFLMPSRYEPCGLNQMYSLRYGAVPIVRATGGLEDSVVDREADEAHATGFKFLPYTSDALLATVDRALAAFAMPKVWNRLIESAMRSDFSWDRSAHEYVDLYKRLQPSV